MASSPNDNDDDNKYNQNNKSPLRLLRESTASVVSGLAFATSVAAGFLTDTTQHRRWRSTVESLQEYLESSGIHHELSNSINARLLDNIAILWRVQTGLENKNQDDEEKGHFLEQSEIEEAQRFMRYATAVYGSDMVRAVKIHAGGRIKPDWRLRKVISQHTGVPEGDIVTTDTSFGGSREHLRHLIAIDHTHKSVILAVRGTFNLPELLIDATAYSRPFCGGEAHSGMADVAEKTWKHSRELVMKALNENKDYELVLTGHSLGAGTVCLLNIMLHQNNRRRVGGRPVRCFAYSCPPVFTSPELAPKAIKNAKSFINGNDVVPFLSVESVRRFAQSLQAVDQETKHMSWVTKTRLVSGHEKPSKALERAVLEANGKSMVPKAGAPILEIPAATTIWIQGGRRQAHSDPHFRKHISRQLGKTGIRVHPRMLIDHFPQNYEYALQALRPSRR